MRLRALGPDWQPPHTALGSTKLRTVFAQVLYEGTKLRNVFAQVLPFCQRLPADFMEDKGHKVKGRGPGRPLKPAATKPPPPGTVSVIQKLGCSRSQGPTCNCKCTEGPSREPELKVRLQLHQQGTRGQPQVHQQP